MPSGGLEIVASVEDDVASIAAAGEIDLATVDSLVDAIAQHAVRNGRLDVDLREVDFMDSSGVAALNRVRRTADELGSELVVRCVEGGPVAQLLEWTGMATMVDVRLEHPSL